MKKLIYGTLFLVLANIVSIPAMAQVDIHIGIPLPPAIIFKAPPAVVVVPDTRGVYVDPDINEDIYFSNGMWWRLWEGRWYRSRYYDRGWAYYNNVPEFYYDVDPDWRRYHHDHHWNGHRWEYERIPYGHLQQNWKRWHDDRHWERHGTWGVRDYKPRPYKERRELRRKREEHFHQRPDVRRHRQDRPDRHRMEKDKYRKDRLDQQKERRKPDQHKERRKPEIQNERRKPDQHMERRRPELQKEKRKPDKQIERRKPDNQKDHRRMENQRREHSQPRVRQGGGDKE